MGFPEFIRENMGNLGWLLDAPGPDEIDASGTLNKKALAAIEDAVQTELVARMKGYYPAEDLPLGKDPNNRWRTVSCMQKAIRFGDVDMAQYAASAASTMDPKYLFRRLAVTAVEDVGAGNVFFTLASLAALGSQAFRKSVDERRLACFLAKELAAGAKDRAICDLLICVDFNHKLPKVEWASLPDDDLIEKIEDCADAGDIAGMMCATWLLAGTKRYAGENMPTSNDRDSLRFRQLMVEAGTSRAFLYMADKTSSRIGESMFASIVHVDNWLQQTEEITFDVQPIANRDKVGKLLGAAYDMHTREGRIAIGKFQKEYADDLERFQKHAFPGMAANMLHFGVFCAEGGQLDRKVVYQHVQELRDLSLKVELGYSGLPDELHQEWLAFLQSRVTELNECRAKVLYAKFGEG